MMKRIIVIVLSVLSLVLFVVALVVWPLSYWRSGILGFCSDALPHGRRDGFELLSRINLFEQPTPRRRITMLAEVRRRIDIPVMADDSVFKPSELDEVLALEACDVVSLYPGKNGGFTNCLSMARRAADCGIQCAIGTALESELGQGAMAALAASQEVFSTEDIGQDLQASVMYEHSSVREPMRFENGYVEVPTGPGFGVEPK